MSKDKNNIARLVENPQDIRFDEEVLVGYTKEGRKFMVVENFLDNRVHQITRHLLQDAKNPTKEFSGYSLEINRFKEGMTMSEVIRFFLDQKVHLWAFLSADYAVSWLNNISDSVRGKVKG